MIKKISISVLLVLFFCSGLFAVDFDELLLKASENSKKMETIKINKANSDLQL